MSPCAAENLTVLELDNCPLITDASLEHLTSCHNLQRVELYDCQLITRVGIKRLRVSWTEEAFTLLQLIKNCRTICPTLKCTPTLRQSRPHQQVVRAVSVTVAAA